MLTRMEFTTDHAWNFRTEIKPTTPQNQKHKLSHSLRRNEYTTCKTSDPTKMQTAPDPSHDMQILTAMLNHSATMLADLSNDRRLCCRPIRHVCGRSAAAGADDYFLARAGAVHRSDNPAARRVRGRVPPAHGAAEGQYGRPCRGLDLSIA